jgi:MerR family regulatory protein
MRIGELAKRAGVSLQAVRFYERRRLMRRNLRHDFLFHHTAHPGDRYSHGAWRK